MSGIVAISPAFSDLRGTNGDMLIHTRLVHLNLTASLSVFQSHSHVVMAQRFADSPTQRPELFSASSRLFIAISILVDISSSRLMESICFFSFEMLL